MSRFSLLRIWESLGTVQFRSNFKKLALANVVAQILLVLAAPILSRLFRPENFGELALYISITSIVTSIATLRFDWLIPNPTSHRIAARLFLAGITLLCLITLIFFFVIFMMGDMIIPDQYTSLRKFAPLMALSVFGIGLHNLYTGWYVRTSNLSKIAKVKIMQSLGNITISILLGYMAFTASGLLFATVISSWLGISLLIYGSTEIRDHLRNLKIKQLFNTITRFSRQAILSTAVSGLNTFSSRAMILLFALVYSPSQVGLIIFAHRLISNPVTVIARGLSKSFWAHTSDLSRIQDYRGLRKDFLKVTYLLFTVAILLFFITLLIQPLIVPLFGPDWSEMGIILIMLMPMVCGATIVSPTNHLVVLGRQGLQLYADILRLVFICLAILAAAIFKWNFVFAVLAVSCSSLLGHLVLFVIQLREQGKLIYKYDNK